jgi:hypothetical protein
MDVSGTAFAVCRCSCLFDLCCCLFDVNGVLAS